MNKNFVLGVIRGIEEYLDTECNKPVKSLNGKRLRDVIKMIMHCKRVLSEDERCTLFSFVKY